MKRSPFSHVNIRTKRGARRSLEDMKHGELEHLLDQEISLHVRAGAARALGFDLIPCYTCGRLHLWKEMDAGHYIGRSNRGTRFDLRNIRPQCTKCNSYQEGMHWKFRQNLVIELGEKEVEALELTASMWGESKHDRIWLIAQIKDWRERNKALRRMT